MGVGVERCGGGGGGGGGCNWGGGSGVGCGGVGVGRGGGGGGGENWALCKTWDSDEANLILTMLILFLTAILHQKSQPWLQRPIPA